MSSPRNGEIRPKGSARGPRRRQILATRLAAVQPLPVQPAPAHRPPVIRRRRALPEAVILRTRLESLTPIEAAVLRALERCRRRPRGTSCATCAASRTPTPS